MLEIHDKKKIKKEFNQLYVIQDKQNKKLKIHSIMKKIKFYQFMKLVFIIFFNFFGTFYGIKIYYKIFI